MPGLLFGVLPFGCSTDCLADSDLPGDPEIEPVAELSEVK